MHHNLFKCLVGSRAHGLNDQDSDYDYRGVFCVPTVEILGLGAKPKATHWIEGDVDDTSWEIGHFLHLATHCNPTILEAFVAPRHGKITRDVDWGDCIRHLFPKVWNSKDVYNAFRGYSLNQRKKFLEDKDGRAWKFAVAYIRTLWQGTILLSDGVLPVKIEDSAMRNMLLTIRRAELTKGDVINIAGLWESNITKAYEKNPNKETDLEAVNDLLLDIRKEFWDEQDLRSVQEDNNLGLHPSILSRGHDISAS